MFVFSCRLMNQLFRVICSFTVDKYSLHLSTGIPKRGSYINAITVSVKCSKHSYQNYICYFYFFKTFSSGFSNFVILPVENSIFVLFICGWVLMSKVKFIKLEFTCILLFMYLDCFTDITMNSACSHLPTHRVLLWRNIQHQRTL